jgi:4'-phosphopantetheinyl transferase
MSFLNKPDDDAEKVVRRLSILLALKEAYIRAIGQPVGFDWSRLEFNLDEKTARGDNHPILGWEFRIFGSHLGVARTTKLVEEKYQCVVAFFRGTQDSSKFIFSKEKKELDGWVQFLYIDQMVKVAPKLYA